MGQSHIVKRRAPSSAYKEKVTRAYRLQVTGVGPYHTLAHTAPHALVHALARAHATQVWVVDPITWVWSGWPNSEREVQEREREGGFALCYSLHLSEFERSSPLCCYAMLVPLLEA
jgi:hypothetical protein